MNVGEPSVSQAQNAGHPTYKIQRRMLHVTVGRAAEMLRISPRAVRQYIHSGVLHAERVDGASQSIQFVLLQSEVRRFLNVLADRRERRPPQVPGHQLQLPLRPSARVTSRPWPLLRPAAIRVAHRSAPPVTERPTRAKGLLPDREAKGPRKRKVSREVA